MQELDSTRRGPRAVRLVVARASAGFNGRARLSEFLFPIIIHAPRSTPDAATPAGGSGTLDPKP